MDGFKCVWSNLDSVAQLRTAHPIILDLPLKTHLFILEAWEALYRAMLVKLIQFTETTETPISHLMDDLLMSVDGESDNEFRLNLSTSVISILQSVSFSFDKFQSFTEQI